MKKNKKHLISAAPLRDRSTEEKLHQLARPLQSPRWMREVWGCSKEHSLLFNTRLSNQQPQRRFTGHLPASTQAHVNTHTVTLYESAGARTSLRRELKWRQSGLVSQPRINPNPIRNVSECRFLLEGSISLRTVSPLDSTPSLWNDRLMAAGFSTSLSVRWQQSPPDTPPPSVSSLTDASAGPPLGHLQWATANTRAAHFTEAWCLRKIYESK